MFQFSIKIKDRLRANLLPKSRTKHSGAINNFSLKMRSSTSPRIPAVFLMITLCLLGVVQAADTERTGNILEPITVSKNDVYFVHDALFKNLGTPDQPLASPLLKIEGGLAILKNVEFSNNFLSNELITIGDGGILLVPLEQPEDYLVIKNNTLSSDSAAKAFIYLSSEDTAGPISPENLRIVETLGYDPLLLKRLTKSLGGNSIFLTGVEGAIFRMTGNRRDGDIFTLLDGPGILIMDGPAGFRFDGLVRAGSTSFSNTTLLVEIYDFDQMASNYNPSGSFSGNGGRIEMFGDDGRLHISDVVVRPILRGPSEELVYSASGSSKHHFFRYLAVDDSNRIEDFTITYSSWAPTSVEGIYTMNLLAEDKRAISYSSELTSSFHYGFLREEKEPLILGSGLYIFDGTLDEGPTVFKNLAGGAIQSQGATILLLGPGEFSGVGGEAVISLLSSSKLSVVLPIAGDRLVFENNGATYDVQGDNFSVKGVEGTSLVLDKDVGLSNFGLDGPLDLYLGTSKLGATNLNLSGNPRIHLTLESLDIDGGEKGVGGKIGVSSTLSGTLILVPRIASHGESSLVDTKYSFTLTGTSSPSSVKVEYGDEDYDYGASIEDYNRLSFSFSSSIIDISGPQLEKLVAGGQAPQSTITSEGAKEPVSFANLSSAALEINGDGKIRLVGSASFDNIANPGKGVIDASSVTGDALLGIFLPSRDDLLEFRGIPKDTWDIHNANLVVTMKGVEGSRIRLSGGLGGENGGLSLSGPVQLELGSSGIYQKHLTFVDDFWNKHPKILISPSEGGSITIQEGGTLIGSLQVIVTATLQEMAGLLGSGYGLNYNYIKPEGLVEEYQYNQYSSTLKSSSPILGVTTDSELPLDSLDYKISMVLFRRHRLISGQQRSRTVVYEDQTTTNDGPVSFSNLNCNGYGCALRVVGILELDSGYGNGPIVFQNNITSDDYGGAIYVNNEGALTLRGSFEFKDNGSAQEGGSIYNSEQGIIRFTLGTQDRVIFFEAPDGGSGSGSNGIHNEGTISIEGALGSIFELGRKVHLVMDNGSTGTLVLKGGLKLVLAGSIIQKEINYENYQGKVPTIAIILKNFSEGGALTVSGNKSAMVGDALLEPILPDESYIGSKTYTYATGTMTSFNPTVVAIHSAVIGNYGVGLVTEQKGILQFNFRNFTWIVSGPQSSPLIVSNVEILTNWGSSREPLVFRNIAGVAVDVQSGLRYAILAGSILFDSLGGSEEIAHGVLQVASGTRLTLLADRTGDSIVFKDTQARTDIYNSSSEGVTVLLTEGTSLELSKGIGGEGGKLSVQGPGLVKVKGTVDQKNISFSDLPTIVFGPDGNQIVVQEEGSITGSLKLAVNLAGSDHFVKKELQYLGADGINLSSFDPSLAAETISFGGRDYDLYMSKDKKNLILWGDPEGDMDERFVVRGYRRIQGARFNGIDSSSETTNAGALEIPEGKTADLVGNTVFSNNLGGAEGAGAIAIKANGTLNVVLPNFQDTVLFANNRIGSAEGKADDISNEGTLNLEGLGTLRLQKGGIKGAEGTLSVTGSSTLDIGAAGVDQKTMTFGDGTTLALTIGRANSEGDWDTARASENGGAIKIQGEGSLVGSPIVSPEFSATMLESLSALENGNSLEYKYLYSEGATISDFRPTLSQEFRFPESSPSNGYLAIKVGFPEEEQVEDPSTLKFSKVDLREAVQDVLETKVQGENEGRKKALDTFFSSLLGKSREVREALEFGDSKKIKEVFREHNPDSHRKSQARALAAPIQSMAGVLGDRMFGISAPKTDFRAALLLAAAGTSRGILEKVEDSTNRVWSKLSINFSTSKLESTTKTQGYGFLLGIDRKFGENITLGLALGLDQSDSSDDESRKTTYQTFSFSIYGNYWFGGESEGLYLSALLTYGMLDSKVDSISGKGHMLHLAPGLGYNFTVLNRKDFRLAIRPEFSLRFLHISQDEQKGSLDQKVSQTSDTALTPTLTLGVDSLFCSKLELSARVGFAYDALSKGDDHYTLTLPDGQSYLLADESDKAKFTTELGINLGYHITNTLRASVGYGGRFSSDLTGNSVVLEIGWEW
ncbi:MAG: autotransporter outer membrane beta-barrel domain-containing protein [Rickettsiales bacterium]|jgi:predicted outer membrane repeat protein|nr:autotransporter outer membrane beta-barrel domain-containing protein [Rickettsiales bacterium]